MIDNFSPTGEPILRCERSEAISGDCRVISLLATTASWATALHPLMQGWGGGSRFVNNPGEIPQLF